MSGVTIEGAGRPGTQRGNGAIAALLPDNRRLHLHHGPIDLIIEAFGPEPERQQAYAQATARFATILAEIVTDLPQLRRAGASVAAANGPGTRMCQAIAPFRAEFVTPMAAVAGAVADEILAAMVKGRRLTRAYVNNGGDIAIFLAPGATLTVALAAGGGRADIAAHDPVRGVATSGWRGRSLSLGIADAVTVLADSAAQADVAATLIANAVDLPGNPAVHRRRACDVNSESDLGTMLVTTGVGRLDEPEIAMALDRGLAVARDYHVRGLIHDAVLNLRHLTKTLRQKEPAHA